MKVQLQVSSGRGPKECNLAVEHVLKVLQQEAVADKIEMRIVHQEFSDGLCCSALLILEGMELNLFLKSWIGSILWICTSPFRPKHARKNWFIAVQETAQVHVLDDIDLKDVVFQTMRSSGAGGQHVNKVSSAVRATHLPTGINVQVMDTRSQLQNKQIALQRLQERVSTINASSQRSSSRSNWEQQIQIERGNPIRTFEGKSFKPRR